MFPIADPPLERCAVPIRSDPFPTNSPEATKLKSLRDHFDDDQFQMPEDKDGSPARGLDDAEKMFLVRLSFVMSWKLMIPKSEEMMIR